MWFLLSVTLALVIVSFGEAANILFANMHNSKSHALSMLPLAKSLADRGHRVAIFTEVVEPGFNLTGGIENIQALVPAQVAERQLALLSYLIWHLDFIPDWIEGGFRNGDRLFQHAAHSEEFSRLLNTSWDMVIGDEYFPNSAATIALHLKKKFNARIATYSTTEFSHASSVLKALARNPAATTQMYLRHDRLKDDPLSFVSRMLAFRDAMVEYLAIGVIGETIIRRSAKKFGFENGFQEFISSPSIMFYEYFDKHRLPKAICNAVVFTTPPCEAPQHMPPDIDEFVSYPSSKGTIYVAFGSLVDWTFAPSNVTKIFVEAFNALNDYRIIWSVGEFVPIGLADHVKTVRWAPQTAILQHNKTRMFFTHGGLKSLREAICAGIPLLTLPFIADQMKNSVLAQQSGFAEVVHKRRINTSALVDTMRTVLEDSRYLQRILNIRSIYNDRVIAPLELETFWTERVLRSKRPQVTFRIHAVGMSFVTYSGLDVISLIVIVIVLMSK